MLLASRNIRSATVYTTSYVDVTSQRQLLL